ncbi:DUF6077 domain-containing protein [Rhodanobacter denitrificans]|uniref:DUF6077 domain-containing protein n=1 Tax=Rhodanobacter denitrificans TaxID=666685 RepID=UPI0002F17248|nr:DUF6077 domain-containing protein [Rhodanobacter denitrificans]UJM90027.1 DUF6077 domain-containing protein [Rhodanobacter denitrificans]
MGRSATYVLILFAGWSLACHAATLLHASLMQACLLAPMTCTLLSLCGRAINRSPPGDLPASGAGAMQPCIAPALIGTLLLLITLHFSWLAFWAGSIVMLALAAYSARSGTEQEEQPLSPVSRIDKVWIVALCIAGALLTLAVSRSDLDDAYYVAVAAFSASHLHAPLLGTDPMFGEHGWPLLFPSYRFSAYEPLAGAIAHALNLPAMDIMHRGLPPLGAIAMVGAIFFCTRETVPQHWVSAGTAVIVLMLLFGEEHRSAANFGFVRAFQGKALFLWIMVPTIFGLSFRYASHRGRPFDLFLLACAQVASIGLSNYATLGAPLAGAVAAISAAPPLSRASTRRWLALSATTLVALPYLIFVATLSHDASALSQLAFEPPSDVWLHVFGHHQQFLIAFLMLLAPFIAGTPTQRWRLAIPPLILFAILLNPLLAPWISRYVTSAPVYWRVTWTFPVLIYLGVAVVLLIDYAKQSHRLVNHATIAAALAIPLAATAASGNSLRPSNHIEWHFASRKLNPADSQVADTILALAGRGRILADDSISAILAMHESHPPLVNVRSMYLKLLAPHMSKSEYAGRAKLAQFVSGGRLPAASAFKAELNRFDVGTVAIRADSSNYATSQTSLMAAGLHLAARCGAYTIWTNTPGTTK